MLARSIDVAIAAYRVFEDTATLSCFGLAFQGALEADTGQVMVSERSEVVREPPLADQSIASRFDYGIAPPGRRAAESRRLFQVTILRKGRGLALLFVANSGEPFPEAERQRLATTLAGRLPS
ncbi:MAG: hypothetical protein ABR540_05570 [Acidimicrobiales bacterium]